MYYVVRSYDFDPETKVVEFTDYEKAKAYLHLNTELVESSGVDMEKTYHEEDFAQIVGDSFWKITYVIAEESGAELEFENVWKQYI